MSKAKKITKPLIAITEELSIDNKTLYTVSTQFQGCFNSRVFNCKPGDTVLLSVDEYNTYKRFLGE